MRITDLEVITIKAGHRGNWLIIKVHTDMGIYGLGEASHSSSDEHVTQVLSRLDKELRGEDPLQIEVLWDKMVTSLGLVQGDWVSATALSAIDQALWDVKGKVLGVPVWLLLGGCYRTRIQLYANINRGVLDRSPRGFTQVAKQTVQAGFEAVKCAPFDEVHYRLRDPGELKTNLDLGLERVMDTRATIGSRVALIVDCHSRFDRSIALKVIAKVKPLNLFWLEEPVPRHQIQIMRELCQSSGLTIAGGERSFGQKGFWDIIVQKALHVIMPDVKHAGGLTECKRVAALAQTHQIPVAPHNPSGPVSTAASVHLAAAIPNFLILEYAFGEVEWRARLVSPKECIQAGSIAVPKSPGLGIELNEDIVETYCV